MGKQAFWMASFRCLAKSLYRGIEQSYIKGSPPAQDPTSTAKHTHTKKEPHKWPENTNALIMTKICQIIITCTGTCISLCFVILYFVCTWYISR